MDDIDLISEVERHPILYDKKRADFKNKNKQNNTWDTVAKCVQEVEVVKARWLCLRQRFSRERAKMSSGAEATDEWELLKYLKFLEPVVKGRKTISNLKKTNDIESSTVTCTKASTSWDSISEVSTEVTSPLEVIVAPNDYDDDESYSFIESSSRATSVELLSPRSVEVMSLKPSTSNDGATEFVTIQTPSEALTPTGTLTLAETPTVSAVKRKRSGKSSVKEPAQKLVLLDNIQNAIQGMNTLINKKTENIPAPVADSDDIFGQFIAFQLKMMSPEEKREKIKKICAIIMD